MLYFLTTPRINCRSQIQEKAQIPNRCLIMEHLRADDGGENPDNLGRKQMREVDYTWNLSKWFAQ